jgi:hypothetical protein
MFSSKKRHISPPGLFVPIPWPFEPIAPWKRKRTPFFTGQPPPYRIFPIRSVNYDFPNIMAPGSGRLRCFARRNTANRTAKVGSVPCGSVVSFVQQSQKMLNFRMRHGFSRRCGDSLPECPAHDSRRVLGRNTPLASLNKERERPCFESAPFGTQPWVGKTDPLSGCRRNSDPAEPACLPNGLHRVRSDQDPAAGGS